MTSLQPNCKPTTLSRSASTIALCFFLLQGIISFTGIAFAKDTATNIDALCNRQSMLMISELSNDAQNELTDRDVNMMRARAMQTCKEIYHEMTQDPDTTPDADTAISKPLNTKTATPDNSENIQTDINSEATAPDNSENIQADINSEATAPDNSENIQANTNADKKSIFSRLFSTTEKKNLNPMQKQHRTGGK